MSANREKKESSGSQPDRRRTESGTRPKADARDLPATEPPPPGPYPPREAMGPTEILPPRFTNDAPVELGSGFRPPTAGEGEDLDLRRDRDRVAAFRKFHEAQKALQRGTYEEAFLLLTDATQFDESRAEYHIALARCLLLRNGDGPSAYSEILKALNRALEIEPTNASALYAKGRVMRRLGKEEVAVGYFQRALESDPHHVDARRAIQISKRSGSDSSPGDFFPSRKK